MNDIIFGILIILFCSGLFGAAWHGIVGFFKGVFLGAFVLFGLSIIYYFTYIFDWSVL
jgi:hypothetical protein